MSGQHAGYALHLLASCCYIVDGEPQVLGVAAAAHLVAHDFLRGCGVRVWCPHDALFRLQVSSGS